MRTGGGELQMDLSEVVSAEQITERVVLGTRNPSNIIISFCLEGSCPGGDPLPTDVSCDPGTTFAARFGVHSVFLYRAKPSRRRPRQPVVNSMNSAATMVSVMRTESHSCRLPVLSGTFA